MCAIAEILLSGSLEELSLQPGLKRDLSFMYVDLRFMYVAVVAEMANCLPLTLI
jgi:hypothetical protein